MAISGGNKVLKTHEIIIAMGAVCLAFGLTLFFAGHWELPSEGFVGETAPEIEFESASGQKMSLSDKRGSVVLVNFWASWCAPCIEEMPSLSMLEQHLKKRGFVLLAFNIGESGSDVLKGKLPSSKMPGNLVFNFPKEQLKPYSIDSIPVSILIDKDGKIQKVYRGPQNWMNIRTIQEIENLINK